MIQRASTTSSPTTRCAIYTRKSSEEGLELDYNSLDAQRDSAEAYITSQAGEGWKCLPDRYDDGGFTGGNMERPALKRLMADIDEFPASSRNSGDPLVDGSGSRIAGCQDRTNSRSNKGLRQSRSSAGALNSETSHGRSTRKSSCR